MRAIWPASRFFERLDCSRREFQLLFGPIELKASNLGKGSCRIAALRPVALGSTVPSCSLCMACESASAESNVTAVNRDAAAAAFSASRTEPFRQLAFEPVRQTAATEGDEACDLTFRAALVRSRDGIDDAPCERAGPLSGSGRRCA